MQPPSEVDLAPVAEQVAEAVLLLPGTATDPPMSREAPRLELWIESLT